MKKFSVQAALLTTLLFVVVRSPDLVPPAQADGTTAAARPADREEAGRWRHIEAQNRELLHRYHVEIWEQGHLDRVGQFLAPTFFSHAVAALPEARINLLVEMRHAFPDLTSHEDVILADHDQVVIRWTIRGTHTGGFLGRAPTGRAIEVSGMDILRVAEGKFVEHWGGIADQIDDILATLEQ
jgi:predicted ester cyclase